jgi:limonene-1,2-epoxide hydrolase
MSSSNGAGRGHRDGTLVERWQTALERYFREGNAALTGVLALYDERVRVQDPLNTVLGLPALVAYNERFLRKVRRAQITFGDVVVGERTAFVSWSMRIVPRFGPESQIEGVSHLTIDNEKIVEERDYFDVTQAVPVVGGLFRALVRLLVA